jgi:hypothetical protein
MPVTPVTGIFVFGCDAPNVESSLNDGIALLAIVVAHGMDKKGFVTG